MTSMTQIKAFSQRIAKEFRPDQIILFGSHANGRPTRDSDVDMLIIMPFEGRSAEKSVEIRMKLRPDFPLDLLVRTPENIRQRLSMGDFFIHDIIRKGTVLYETHNP